MPGCRRYDTASPILPPPRRVELRRYVRHGAKPPRACNDNRRAGAAHGWYWMVLVGAMPTLGLLAVLSTLL